MSIPTAEQIAKLPKWAQEHIADLERRREAAVRNMQEAADADTPSPFYYEDHVCVESGSPRNVRRYIQSRWLRVSHRGLDVNLILRTHGKDCVLDISYGSDRGISDRISFEPRAFQQFYLYCPEQKS